MGRAEAFAMKEPPGVSFLDGIGNGLGYGFILITVAFFRELLGFGTIIRYRNFTISSKRWLVPSEWFISITILFILRNRFHHLGYSPMETRAS